MSDWETYTKFVRERHRVWERRMDGEPGPWTDDPILQQAKFTNVFRVLDPGSQYLLELLLFGDVEGDLNETFARAMLYRYTNRRDGWDYFAQYHGRYPLISDLADGTLVETWTRFRAAGGKLQSTAYRVFAHPNRPKGQTYIEWLAETALRMLETDVPARVTDRVGDVRAQVDIFGELPRCGDFMGMQILTDVGYTGILGPDYSEEVYAVPGIGAHTGAKALGMTADAAIQMSYLDHRVAGGVELNGLPPSMMDIQNTFCEFGKYARMRSLGKITMPFRQQHAIDASSTYRLSARWGADAFTPRTRRPSGPYATM